MLKIKIRPLDGSWQEFNLSVRSPEGLFIKLARCVQLGRGSLFPGHGAPRAPGRDTWAHQAPVTAVRDTRPTS